MFRLLISFIHMVENYTLSQKTLPQTSGFGGVGHRENRLLTSFWGLATTRLRRDLLTPSRHMGTGSRRRWDRGRPPARSRGTACDRSTEQPRLLCHRGGGRRHRADLRGLSRANAGTPRAEVRACRPPNKTAHWICTVKGP